PRPSSRSPAGGPPELYRPLGPLGTGLLMTRAGGHARAGFYSPFIIAGRASWVDTWGAPRYGPGALVRTHEGQDVFCDSGAPVLASEPGIIEFDQGGLGGRVARLFRNDGSYWYYAHLSGWNTRRFSSGDRVEAGDIIGYCGNSGNASGTSAHVHFGWYGADGRARDPFRHLVRWLAIAERKHGIDPGSSESAAFVASGFGPGFNESFGTPGGRRHGSGSKSGKSRSVEYTPARAAPDSWWRLLSSHGFSDVYGDAATPGRPRTRIVRAVAESGLDTRDQIVAVVLSLWLLGFALIRVRGGRPRSGHSGRPPAELLLTPSAPRQPHADALIPTTRRRSN
ncbi:MAG: M23 family metallopeptidase, partial [Actinobacteria bacterium]|nr:M23 family metallopeptidase [Actinomycetota bacterium]